MGALGGALSGAMFGGMISGAATGGAATPAGLVGGAIIGGILGATSSAISYETGAKRWKSLEVPDLTEVESILNGIQYSGSKTTSNNRETTVNVNIGGNFYGNEQVLVDLIKKNNNYYMEGS